MKRLAGLTSGQVYTALAPQPSDYAPLQIGSLDEALPMRAIRRRPRRRMQARAKRVWYWLPEKNILRMAETSLDVNDTFRFRHTLQEKRAMVALAETLT